MVHLFLVHYLDFLRGLHAALRPPTYLEIGVRSGGSLALSSATTIGIDPAFAIKHELNCPVTLARTTSDEFFLRPDAMAAFGGHPIALSFIDGMHLFEHALRDFINVEARSDWSTVIVFDDILPRSVDEAARERHTKAWTGDVYKVLLALQRHRPDLVCLPIRTEPTGLLAVIGADPASDVLAGHYEKLIAELVVPDPQPVPAPVLQRTGTLDPEQVLAAPLWSWLRDARDHGIGREEGLPQLRRAVAAAFEPGRGAVRRRTPALLRRRG
jgi:hypothetical protein